MTAAFAAWQRGLFLKSLRPSDCVTQQKRQTSFAKCFIREIVSLLVPHLNDMYSGVWRSAGRSAAGARLRCEV